MKHKIKTESLSQFSSIYDYMMDRLKEAGEEVVKVKFHMKTWYMDSFKATIWTKRRNGDTNE